MNLPGSSLFNGGSIHFDGLTMGPEASGGAEEEAEAAEEEERRNQEVTHTTRAPDNSYLPDLANRSTYKGQVTPTFS